MIPKFLIQEMEIGDFEEAQHLWQATEGIELTEIDSKDCVGRFLLRNPGLSFVARDQDKLIGVVLCGHDGRRGYIDQLAVDKNYRLQGVGRSLVARCLFNLMRIGINKLHLFVAENNHEAFNFWKKLGWSQRVELVTMARRIGLEA